MDFNNLGEALTIARKLSGLSPTYKIGKQLFTAEGPAAVRAISRLGHGIFLDLKYHDIPNTVAGAVAAAARLPGVRLLNVHTLGGAAMMKAAAAALRRAIPRGRARPKLLGVTILTSMNTKSMRTVGISGKPLARAVHLARLAKKCGLDGVVSSAHEAAHIRRACGPGFIILVGGIRPAMRGGKHDQARVATPAEAIRAGADYLVVGRPITGATDPNAAAAAILEEMRLALRSRV